MRLTDFGLIFVFYFVICEGSPAVHELTRARRAFQVNEKQLALLPAVPLPPLVIPPLPPIPLPPIKPITAYRIFKEVVALTKIIKEIVEKKKKMKTGSGKEKKPTDEIANDIFKNFSKISDKFEKIFQKGKKMKTSSSGNGKESKKFNQLVSSLKQ